MVAKRQTADRAGRSLALAQARHTVGLAVWTGYAHGVERWAVPSTTVPGQCHEVTRAGLVFRCDCIAGAYGRACCHVGAAMQYCESRAALAAARSAKAARRLPSAAARDDVYSDPASSAWV